MSRSFGSVADSSEHAGSVATMECRFQIGWRHLSTTAKHQSWDMVAWARCVRFMAAAVIWRSQTDIGSLRVGQEGPPWHVSVAICTQLAPGCIAAPSSRKKIMWGVPYLEKPF